MRLTAYLREHASATPPTRSARRPAEAGYDDAEIEAAWPAARRPVDARDRRGTGAGATRSWSSRSWRCMCSVSTPRSRSSVGVNGGSARRPGRLGDHDRRDRRLRLVPRSPTVPRGRPWLWRHRLRPDPGPGLPGDPRDLPRRRDDVSVRRPDRRRRLRRESACSRCDRTCRCGWSSPCAASASARTPTARSTTRPTSCRATSSRMDGAVYLRRICRRGHGEVDEPVRGGLTPSGRTSSSGASRRARSSPDTAGNARPIPMGYMDGLGDLQTQHSCILLIDVTENCNLHCPTCFAESGPGIGRHARLPHILRSLDAAIEREGGRVDALMLSGGEPTVHPEIARDHRGRDRAEGDARGPQHEWHPDRARRRVPGRAGARCAIGSRSTSSSTASSSRPTSTTGARTCAR